MEGVYEAVVARLSMLGYTVTDADKAGLEYLIHKCEVDILTNTNHRELPKGLFYTLVDMVAGQFLFNKKAAGGRTCTCGSSGDRMECNKVNGTAGTVRKPSYHIGGTS